MLDVVLLVEQMGYACLPGPFITSAVVVTSLLAAAAKADQPKRLLPVLASGELIATLALTEENGSGDPDDVALACRVPGRLTGRKLFVKDAHVADVLAVVVRESEGLGLVLLPSERRGISRIQLAAISGEKMFEVVFDDVEVTAADRLGAAGDRKSTRLNSSHQIISYAVFCLKKKNIMVHAAALTASRRFYRYIMYEV